MPYVSEKEADSFIELSKLNAKRVGLAVATIITGVSVLIALSSIGDYHLLNYQGNSDVMTIIGVVVLLCMVTGAVGVIVYSGMQAEKYQYIDRGIQLDPIVTEKLHRELQGEKTGIAIATTVGVCMCIIAVVPLLLTSLLPDSMESVQVIAVSLLLLFIAVAVFLFISFGGRKEAYEKLLQIGEHTIDRKKNEKVIGAVAALVWPLTVAVFLAWGFLRDGWAISWVVFPIVGVLFGGFSAVYNAIKGE